MEDKLKKRKTKDYYYRILEFSNNRLFVFVSGCGDILFQDPSWTSF